MAAEEGSRREVSTAGFGVCLGKGEGRELLMKQDEVRGDAKLGATTRVGKK